MKPLQVFVGSLTLFVLASGQINTVAADDPIELDPIIVEAEQKRIEAIARAMPSVVQTATARRMVRAVVAAEVAC